MWTYLAILFSFVLLVGVFIRRWILMNKQQFREEEVAKEELVSKDEEPEVAEVAEKKKLSKNEKEELAELYERGETFIKTGKDEEAVKCFVQVLAIDPSHQETLERLAMLYLQKQMYSAACALLSQLGEITQEAVHYSHLGLAYFQQAEYEDAKNAYQKALTLDDSRPQRFVSLSQVYKALGQLQNAIIALNKALEMDRENIDFMFLMVDLHLEKGLPVQAKNVLEEILEKDPKNVEAKEALKKIKKSEEMVEQG